MTLAQLKQRTEYATKLHEDIVALKAVPMNPEHLQVMDGCLRKHYLTETLLREVFREGMKVVLSQREKELDGLLNPIESEAA